ncbi:MAG: DsbA family protein [Steroidobacteraceae bacterium]|jgi:protein-disulfide isomerase
MPQAHNPELAVPIAANDHVLGPGHAPVTVLEYGDFECPSCKLAAPAVTMLLERFPERVRFVFRHFPIESAHPHALVAAEVSEIAAAQGRFWPMHASLFEHQPHFAAAQLYGYGEDLGLDMGRYQAELEDHIYLQRIREHEQGARASGVRASPAFFVNGRVQDVSFGMQHLYDAVAALLARG